MLEPCPTKSCPFCCKSFKALGSHLRHCPKRDGQDYQAYLSQKTRAKKEQGPRKKPCTTCGKFFLRLDTHLRTSATCRPVPNSPPHACQQPSPQQSCLPTSELPSELPFFSSSLTPLSKPLILPSSKEEWQAADDHLAATVVPAVLSASTVDEKHNTLCSGVYSYFSSTYGT